MWFEYVVCSLCFVIDEYLNRELPIYIQRFGQQEKNDMEVICHVVSSIA